MEFKISGSTEPLLHASLDQGERIVAESDAMVAMSGTMTIAGSMRDGFLSSLMRKVAGGESFFLQEIEATHGAGIVLLAPRTHGDVAIVDVGPRQYRLTDGAFLASSDGVRLEACMQRPGTALFGDSGGFLVLRTGGSGRLAVAGAGSIREITVTAGSVFVVDNGHLVAWEDSMTYELTVPPTKDQGIVNRLFHSQTSGEGLVFRFTGPGRIMISSRNVRALH